MSRCLPSVRPEAELYQCRQLVALRFDGPAHAKNHNGGNFSFDVRRRYRRGYRFEVSLEVVSDSPLRQAPESEDNKHEVIMISDYVQVQIVLRGEKTFGRSIYPAIDSRFSSLANFRIHAQS
jgi:hypothetical protein